MGFSATLESAQIASESGLDPIWLVKLYLNDLDVSISRLQVGITEIRANIGVAEGKRNFDQLARVVHLAHSGRPEDLLGLAETAWLDFKSYVDFESESARIELAEDIARFANAERPGLLVIGYRTVRKDGEDVATKLAAVLSSKNSPNRYEDVIDARVYPHVRGLSIERIAVDESNCIVLIYVPAQREDDKPFLVQGTVVEGKIERTFFSIVRRRGDGSIPITAREIHAFLSAGRRALAPRTERG